MMIKQSFTGILAHNDSILLKKYSATFEDLLIHMLILLDDYPNAHGFIIDNRIKKIIYRCRRTTCYE
jgi:hypothetical protein